MAARRGRSHEIELKWPALPYPVSNLSVCACSAARDPACSLFAAHSPGFGGADGLSSGISSLPKWSVSADMADRLLGPVS